MKFARQVNGIKEPLCCGKSANTSRCPHTCPWHPQGQPLRKGGAAAALPTLTSRKVAYAEESSGQAWDLRAELRHQKDGGAVGREQEEWRKVSCRQGDLASWYFRIPFCPGWVRNWSA